MAKKINLKSAKSISPNEVLDVINGGIQIVDAAAPVLKVLFDKIGELINSLGKKNPDSPRNVRLRLAALEAQNKLQKELNKTYEERLAKLETGLPLGV